VYVCLLHAVNLLLNGYLLDKWIGIGNMKYDTLLHDYLWSQAQNSQTYTNIYGIICMLDHIFISSSILFIYLFQFRISHNSYISCFIELFEKPASESSYPIPIPTFTFPFPGPISALPNSKTQFSSGIPAVYLADSELKSRRETG